MIELSILAKRSQVTIEIFTYRPPAPGRLFNLHFPDHKYSVNAVSLSPGGTLLCSASTDGTSRLWDARTGSELASLVQPSGAAVRTAAFCPGASVLASAGDDEVRYFLHTPSYKVWSRRPCVCGI